MNYLETGIHNIDFETYLEDPCPAPSLSRGTIVDLLDAPAKAFWNHPRLNTEQKKEEDEGKFDIGKAYHNMVLEGGKKVYVVSGYSDWRTKDAKEQRKEYWEAGLIPLLQKQYDNLLGMVEAAKKQVKECTELEITGFSKDGKAEQTFIWQESNGVWCRIRPDWFRNDGLLAVDLKSTATSVNPNQFSRHLMSMNYHIQASFYKRGVQKVTGKTPEFIFMAQETTVPYLCSFFGIDPLAQSIADEKVDLAIRLWRKHLDTGKWPGYPKRICWAEAKIWELDEWENKKKDMEEGNE